MVSKKWKTRWKLFFAYICFVLAVEHIAFLGNVKQSEPHLDFSGLYYSDISETPNSTHNIESTSILSTIPTPPFLFPTFEAKYFNAPIEQNDGTFYSKNDTKINPFKHTFVIPGENICQDNTDMMILIHSLHTYRDRRDAIRQTWGSVAKKMWPGAVYQEKISLGFIFGTHKDQKWNEKIKVESEEHKDIIQGDFIEAYKNMTFKSLLGFKWMLSDCSSAKYLLKSDDDMFINIPYLLYILRNVKFSHSILGPFTSGSKTLRKGKWGLTEKELPFKNLPPYEVGAAYIISGDLIQDLFETAEYVTPFHVDDVYITGVIGKILNVTHVLHNGFAFAVTRAVKICDIVQNKMVTSTKMRPVLLRSLWNSLSGKPTCPEVLPAANAIKPAQQVVKPEKKG